MGKEDKEIFLNFPLDVFRQYDTEHPAASMDQNRTGHTPRSKYSFKEDTGIQGV